MCRQGLPCLQALVVAECFAVVEFVGKEAVCRGDNIRINLMRFVPKSVQLVEMDIFFLRVDVPKERFSSELGANKAVFAAYDGAVGKVEQFVEILLGNERDFD